METQSTPSPAAGPTKTVSVYWEATMAFEIHDLEVPVGATREEILRLALEDGGGYCAGTEEVDDRSVEICPQDGGDYAGPEA